jgi:hypothetical protein
MSSLEGITEKIFKERRVAAEALVADGIDEESAAIVVFDEVSDWSEIINDKKVKDNDLKHLHPEEILHRILLMDKAYQGSKFEKEVK